jgi:hypothetical protein
MEHTVGEIDCWTLLVRCSRSPERSRPSQCRLRLRRLPWNCTGRVAVIRTLQETDIMGSEGMAE